MPVLVVYAGLLEQAVEQYPSCLHPNTKSCDQHYLWSLCLRQADSVERHPAVWSSGDGKVLPGKGRGHGGQQLHVLLCLLLRPHVQVAGRE